MIHPEYPWPIFYKKKPWPILFKSFWVSNLWNGESGGRVRNETCSWTWVQWFSEHLQQAACLLQLLVWPSRKHPPGVILLLQLSLSFLSPSVPSLAFAGKIRRPQAATSRFVSTTRAREGVGAAAASEDQLLVAGRRGRTAVSPRGSQQPARRGGGRGAQRRRSPAAGEPRAPPRQTLAAREGPREVSSRPAD